MPCFPSKARTAEYREGLYVDCPYYEIVKRIPTCTWDLKMR